MPLKLIGSSLFVPSGTGAGARDVNDRLGETVSVKDFKARGDGVTDDTAAIQHAIDAVEARGGGIVFVPPGSYKTTAALRFVGSGLRFKGHSRSAAQITNLASDVFELANGVTNTFLEFSDFTVNASGGHIFSMPGGVGDGVSRSQFRRLDLQQNATNKRIFNQSEGIFIDNLIAEVNLAINPLTTVSVWKHLSSIGGVNQNLWCGIRATNSVDYVFDIQNTGGGNYAYDNRFIDINFEVCNGGGIRLHSVHNAHIVNCNFYDLGTTTKHLISVDKASTGLPSVGVEIAKSWRKAGTLGTGLMDIHIQQSAKTVIWNCGAVGSTHKIDLNNNASLLINQSDSTIINFLDSSSSSATIAGFTSNGSLFFSADATFDIGSGNKRPRDIFLSRNLDVGGTAKVNGFTYRYGASEIFQLVAFANQNGVIALANGDLSGFDRLQFGGQTSSFPSLKRNGAMLQARLADDSADADFQARAFIASLLPGSDPHVAGKFWNNAGVVNVSSG